jgi:hypothetical protein
VQELIGYDSCVYLLRQLRERVILIKIILFRGGFIDEKIYEYNNDPDQVVEELLKMTPEEL